MPKQTFLNIDEDKRQTIIREAMIEFSRYSLNEASVSRIVRNSNISKGSFYQYFLDIDDLYGYIFQTIYEEELKRLRSIKKENKTIFEYASDVVSSYYDVVNDQSHMFYHALKNNNTLYIQDYFIGRKGQSIIDEIELQMMSPYFVELLVSLIVHTLSASVIRRQTKQETIEMFSEFLKILKEGYHV